MTILIPVVAVSPLRQRLIDEMDIRRFGPERVRRYARPITVPARVRIGKDLRSLANEDLAMLFKTAGRKSRPFALRSAPQSWSARASSP